MNVKKWNSYISEKTWTDTEMTAELELKISEKCKVLYVYKLTKGAVIAQSV
jgi:hypothetical protein